jgi:long-chain fatty acid transport protein
MTMAYKALNKHGIGVTPILAYQRFQAEGLEAFGAQGFSSDHTKLTNNGHDSVWGFGFRIGYMGQLTEKFSLGGSYQSKVWMSKLDKYAGLFAEQGGFDVPSTWTVGIGITPREDLAFALDLQQIRYSEVKSVGNPMLPNLQTALLGDDNGAGFGWVDILVFKGGVQYQSHENWTWRAGYSYNEQPIPESEMMFNILAPGVPQHHITAGFSHVLKERNDLSFALMYSPSNTVTGPNPLDPAQTIELEMSQWEIVFGYAFF